MWLHISIGTLKGINFPFVPNGKLIILGITKLSHITVVYTKACLWVYGHTSVFSASFSKGNNFCEFLFASLEDVALSFQKGVYIKRKEFAHKSKFFPLLYFFGYKTEFFPSKTIPKT